MAKILTRWYEFLQFTAKQEKEENKRDASLETGLIGEDIVSKTKMINGWEKGKKERARERERERAKKMKTNVESFLINQQRRVRAANWHEAVVAVSPVE